MNMVFRRSAFKEGRRGKKREEEGRRGKKREEEGRRGKKREEEGRRGGRFFPAWGRMPLSRGQDAAFRREPCGRFLRL
ncbi:hypothetical protein CXT89_01115 [Akkermansia muciniphila]|nr:hypothetical protein CXT89_01115 [Akkermansia muciniphila]